MSTHRFLSLSVSALALTLACPPSTFAEPEQPSPLTEQTLSDHTIRQVTGVTHKAFSVQRRLQNISENIQMDSANQDEFWPLLKREVKNLAQLSTQMDILDEKMSEELETLDQSLAFAKQHGDKDRIMALQKGQSTLKKQKASLATHAQKARETLSNALALIDHPPVLPESEIEISEDRKADLFTSAESLPLAGDDSSAPETLSVEDRPEENFDSEEHLLIEKEEIGLIPLPLASNLPRRAEEQKSLLVSVPIIETSATQDTAKAKTKNALTPPPTKVKAEELEPIVSLEDSIEPAPIVNVTPVQALNQSKIGPLPRHDTKAADAAPAYAESNPIDKAPLRTLGQQDDNQPSYTSSEDVVSPPPQTLVTATHQGYSSPPLAVLDLDQGASAFQWYVFSAINRGLYKDPNMKFDIIEYSEDANAPGAREVHNVLISLGLEPSQLHVKHASTEGEPPQIKVYPTQ